jgi:hypothetical protein
VPTHELNRVTLIGAAQVTDELQAMQMPVNSRGWQKERATYGGVLQQQGAGLALNLLLNAERGIAIRRAKRAVGCLLWMDGASRRDIDAAITRHMPSRDGAAYAQAAASRTRDLIDIVIEIAQLVHPEADLVTLADTLPVQLELGVPEGLVPLARIIGQQLTRSDYLQLRDAGYGDVTSIANATDEDLRVALRGSKAKLRLLRDATDRARGDEEIAEIAALLQPTT